MTTEPVASEGRVDDDRIALARWHRVGDCAAWAVAIFVAASLRIDLEYSQLPDFGLALAMALAVLCHIAAAAATGLYAGRWRPGSFDEVAALAGAFAVMVALRHRDRTGEGQVVDVNLLESMLQMMSALPSAAAHLGYEQPRLGSGIPYSVPRGTYCCADGGWIAISTSSESVAHRVLTLLGIADDPRFATFESRAAHREELDRRLESTDAASFSHWSEAKARILGSK